jgi:hypothetical protein
LMLRLSLLDDSVRVQLAQLYTISAHASQCGRALRCEEQEG